jgi:hypothetical protein
LGCEAQEGCGGFRVELGFVRALCLGYVGTKQPHHRTDGTGGTDSAYLRL